MLSKKVFTNSRHAEFISASSRLIKRGFTLIELLVVVLIIGILAAVAVPQYQKAVEKSKATQAVTLLKSLSQATKIYEEATGTWPSSFDVLDVTLPGDFKPTTPEKVMGYNSVDTRSNGEWEIQLEKNRPVFYHDKIFMVRTNGRYKGAGFMYARSGLYPASLEKKIHCMEPWLGGIYCRKLFGGTVVANGKWQLFSYR